MGQNHQQVGQSDEMCLLWSLLICFILNATAPFDTCSVCLVVEPPPSPATSQQTEDKSLVGEGTLSWPSEMKGMGLTVTPEEKQLSQGKTVAKEGETTVAEAKEQNGVPVEVEGKQDNMLVLFLAPWPF